MRQALMASVRDALDRPRVLDMGATIKPLYGHQEGAELGYNPHKPGRPSHVPHTFWVGNLRLVLDTNAQHDISAIGQRIVGQMTLPTLPPALAAPG